MQKLEQQEKDKDQEYWSCQTNLNDKSCTTVYHIRPQYTILDIQDHFAQGRNHSWKFGPILNCFSTLWLILDTFGPHYKLFGYFWSFWAVNFFLTIFDHLWIFGTCLDLFAPVCTCLGQFGPIMTYWEPFGTIWTNQSPVGPIWTHLDPFGSIRTPWDPFG